MLKTEHTLPMEGSSAGGRVYESLVRFLDLVPKPFRDFLRLRVPPVEVDARRGCDRKLARLVSLKVTADARRLFFFGATELEGASGNGLSSSSSDDGADERGDEQSDPGNKPVSSGATEVAAGVKAYAGSLGAEHDKSKSGKKRSSYESLSMLDVSSGPILLLSRSPECL